MSSTPTHSMTKQPGRRELKKAALRKTISNIATTLFLERGFDNVGIREIADKAGVSPTTLFAYFPQKEALIFDEDDDQRAQLVATVHNRPAGVSISEALRAYFATEIIKSTDDYGDDAFRNFMALVNDTPALADYAQRMWLRHGDALAQAIANDLGYTQPTNEIRAYARFVIQIQLLVLESHHHLPMLEAAFRVLDEGWSQVLANK